MNPQTILIIEDDDAIREGIKILLEAEGYLVQEAPDGISGLEQLQDATALVILDIMMPGISGITVCENIRRISNVPVLFLTAKDQEADKLIGLAVGGDDYLVKPFSFAELLARIRALLRRHTVYDRAVCPGNSSGPGDILEQGDVRISIVCNQVWVRGRAVALTELEYQLLLLLVNYPGKVFSIRNLYESIWQEPFIYTSGNTVMVHIRRLRKKIEKDPQNPQLIETVWGKGYRYGRLKTKDQDACATT